MPAEASRATFEKIMQHLAQGERDAALEKCQTALQRSPSDVNMLGLMGAILIQASQPKQAEKLLRRTIELAPTFAKPHEDLGMLLVALNRSEEAIGLLKKAVRLDPELESAWFHLGKALARTGNGKEADLAYEEAFKLAPQRQELARAAESLKQGRPEEAEGICRRILQREKNNVDAMRLLALIAAQSGKTDDAEILLERVTSLAPDYNLAQLDLGNIYREQDRYSEAIHRYQKVIDNDPDNAQAHFLLAGVLSQAALNERAIDSYQRCIELQPEHAAALLGLGHALKTVGQQEAAITAYRQCTVLRPENGESWSSMANLKTYEFSDAEIVDMHSAIADQELEPSSAVHFYFALAKAYENRHQYSQAWGHYVTGNHRQRQLVSYDPVRTELLNDAIIEVFSEEFLEANAGSGNLDASPIFILGMPRSGSTLTEQILASHSQVEGTSELPYIGRLSAGLSRNRSNGINYPEAVREVSASYLQKLGDEYLQLAQMHRIQGAPRFVDKMPNNFPNIGLIHLILPNAKIIDARRNPLDACLGNFKQLYARGQNFTYDITEIAEYCLEYHRLMDHWEKVLPGKILRVQYEDTVLDLQTQVQQLLTFCELPWESACLHFHDTERAVRTASSEQVRQPIYTGAINFWRHYAEHLDELTDILQPLLGRY
ncbi:sulfotransferase family protein [Halieaceae bacterium IMCC14734]|uniref:Sulfotransferase family protein n=1 Tax=Candidatus Litorirhabdus singularis TaxID=2518993 RepID=A0ABT3TKZ6_9GAMM|nr:tetratricopeptide repeat-containing sulfotransferase family protein [Candidatus Litorirhabdus singularis]MCX2983006.1 sulfotransferase family protein [Candidatus Litorirhabdus singularis]